MKQLISLLVALFLSFSISSQSFFWAAYNIKVKAGEDKVVVNAIDEFMNSKAGKSMVATTLTGKLFSNADQSFTHQVIFGSSDKAALANMYTGLLQQSPEFQLLGKVLDNASESAGSYLCKTIYSTGNTLGNYSSVLSLRITDPDKYLKAFKKLSSGINASWGDDIGISLFQVLSGNEEEVTHAVVISYPTFELLLDFSDQIYSTHEFALFHTTVNDIRFVKSNYTTATLKWYNLAVSDQASSN